MSCVTVTRRPKANLRLDLQHAVIKQQQDFESVVTFAGCSGFLSPNSQPTTPQPATSQPTTPQPPILSPPTTPLSYVVKQENIAVSRIGNKYLLFEHLLNSPLRRCISIETSNEYVCKIVPNDRYQETLLGHFRLESHQNINTVEEVLIGEKRTYVIYSRGYGDLHLYVRHRKHLREAEAVRLFRQVVTTVAACHEAGIVLRDLKLRKFVFKNPERTQLKLETFDDAVILDKDNDWLNDKHGCPAYVSPEILTTANHYSGKAADCWSLGIMLYTMLVGRYPFHDLEPNGLFSKIRRGCYSVPDYLSSKAKCLIKNLLRMDPKERLTAEEVLDHPWFKIATRRNSNFLDTLCYGSNEETNVPDQLVPDTDSDEDSSSLFI